jgi:hypothetical protein
MPYRVNFDWKSVPAEAEAVLESDKQRVAFHLLRTGNRPKDITEALGVDQRNYFKMAARIRELIHKSGYDPVHHMTLMSPSPQVISGRSSLVKVDEDGKETVAMYWNKTNVKQESQVAAFRSAIESLAEGITPFVQVPAKQGACFDLLTVYTLTDFHLGMYAWQEETGASWDMKIAEGVLLNAFSDMMSGSPDSRVGIFAQLGDLLHWDGMLATTPTAKNVLDADTRFPLLVQTAISVCLKVIEMLLHKHDKVHVLMAEGNHDMASSVWMRAIMKNTFRDNPRVSVDASPFPFYHYRWGKTFLGWHHGHLQKMDSLPLLFATDPQFKSDYGQCNFTYIHTGHFHHTKVIDKGGIIVEQHPTLSARDAYGARGFLYSNREAKAITYHNEHGEVSRSTVRPNFT